MADQSVKAAGDDRGRALRCRCG